MEQPADKGTATVRMQPSMRSPVQKKRRAAAALVLVLSLPVTAGCDAFGSRAPDPLWELTGLEAPESALPDPAAKLGVFSTSPAIRAPISNLVTEAIGAFALVIVVIAIGSKLVAMPGFLGPVVVGLLVWAIGNGLGGPTGYAINPARDLGPRIAHALLPIAGKGGSDWSYAWIPVVGPLIGGMVAVGVAGAFGMN